MHCLQNIPKETAKPHDTHSNIAPESLHFIANSIGHNEDGSKYEIDTLTGYGKYYFSNGKLKMEGKITKGSLKDYRDGIWEYYYENGLLMRQDTYNKEGKVNTREFMYFNNNNPLSETYQYFEGNYKDKSTFKFHKIEKIFYTNGQELAERHWINNALVDSKCWDPQGNEKPIKYLDSARSFYVGK
jgi:antitoxin component YwqK of YwqJK toxin-antitoxin module